MNLKKTKYTNTGIIWMTLTAVILFIVVSYYFYGYYKLGDDTYIYLQYAKHILNDGEMAFNKGIESFGFTSPLWLILIVGFSYITGSLVSAPEMLTLLFSAFTVVVWAYILRSMEIKKKIIFFLFLMVIVLDPNLSKHSHLGMEASLSYFLSSLIILVLLVLNGKKQFAALGFILALYNLVRPESILIGIVLFVYFFFSKEHSKRDLIYLFLPAIILLPWYIFAYTSFNQFLPNTFYAKGASYPLGTRIWKNLTDSLKIFAGNYFAALGFIFFYLFTYLKFDKNRKSMWALPFGVIIISFIMFYSLVINNEFVYARYYCIVFPFLSFLFIEIVMKCVSNKIIPAGIVSAVSLLLIIWFSLIGSRIYTTTEITENKIIEWVNNNTSPNTKIERGRIGKIAFYTDRYIVDPMGIIDPEIINYHKTHSVADYYYKIKPDIFTDADPHFLEYKGYVNKIELLKEITTNSRIMIRQYFSGVGRADTIKIYKVTWTGQN